MPSRFDTDTAVSSDGDGRFAARIDPGWFIMRGPNGGYLAAIVVRAFEKAAGDPARTPRSLTIHYLRPPTDGSVSIAVDTERTGRTVTTMSARMEQDGKPILIALAAFATEPADPPRHDFADVAFPTVPGPDELEPPPPAPTDVVFRHRFETRWAIGTMPWQFGGGKAERAEVGGWIRLTDEQPVTVAVVAALTDAWIPAFFSKMVEPTTVPTVDLTIHFREPPPGRHEWCFVRFRSRWSSHGFVEEDGEVWSADGRLLAQSRQLAIVLDLPG